VQHPGSQCCSMCEDMSHYNTRNIVMAAQQCVDCHTCCDCHNAECSDSCFHTGSHGSGPCDVSC